MDEDWEEEMMYDAREYLDSLVEELRKNSEEDEW